MHTCPIPTLSSMRMERGTRDWDSRPSTWLFQAVWGLAKPMMKMALI